MDDEGRGPRRLTFALGYGLYCAAAIGYLGWTLGKGILRKLRNRKRATNG